MPYVEHRLVFVQLPSDEPSRDVVAVETHGTSLWLAINQGGDRHLEAPAVTVFLTEAAAERLMARIAWCLAEKRAAARADSDIIDDRLSPPEQFADAAIRTVERLEHES